MNVYWVADSYESMNELELLYVFSSVKVWKYFHPNHKTILFTDKGSWEVIGADNLWDEVIFHDFETDIIKGTHKFWAAGKLQAMKEFKAPFSIMDLDVIYTDIVEFGDREKFINYSEQNENPMEACKTCPFPPKTKKWKSDKPDSDMKAIEHGKKLIRNFENNI